MANRSAATTSSGDAGSRDAKKLEALIEHRDLMAFNCVGAIQFVLLVFEAQDFERSQVYLREALEMYKDADNAITEFHRTHALNLKKENQHVRSATPVSKTDVA